MGTGRLMCTSTASSGRGMPAAGTRAPFWMDIPCESYHGGSNKLTVGVRWAIYGKERLVRAC